MTDELRPQAAIEPELLAHALGELDAGERERLERALEADPGRRSRLEELRATVAALSELPDEAWDEIDAPPLAPLLAPVAIDSGRERPRRAPRAARLRGLLRPAPVGLAGAALALGVVIGVLASSSRSAPRSPTVLASSQLSPIGGESRSAHGVFRLTADSTGRLQVSGLAPTDSRHVYELWLMDSTSDLISIATFRVSAAGDARITLPLPSTPSHFRYLDVSLQPLDGTALHSSDSVLRGPAPA